MTGIRLENCDDQVLNLVQSLNVNIQTAAQQRILSYILIEVGGLFCPKHDTIVLNETNFFAQVRHSNMVVLHELIHWSGMKQRCNREAIVLAIDGVNRSSKDDQIAEEYTANLGSIILLKQLGLDAEVAIDHHSDFMRQYPQNDIQTQRSQNEAERAANWIINESQQKIQKIA